MSDPETPTPDAAEEAPPTTREELWKRIRRSSRDEVILDEMIRLGFWPSDTDKPEPSAKVIRRIAEIERELKEFAAERARLKDRDQLLKEIRKRRLAQARQKRQETKERRERERQERAAAWQRRKGGEVLYLGDGVSAGLGRRECDAERLARHGLPRYDSAKDLAEAMGIELAELRFLAFHRAVSKTTHYRRFEIPKRTGGVRQISAPMPRLKEAQRWILDHVLSSVDLDDHAHGFRTERSIVTNASPHVGRDLVVNLDLRDFFPTVTYRRVRGLWKSLGYSEEVATIFALLTTEPETDAVELDGETYYVRRGERHLPQGSPASPAITNVMCRRLDRRLQGLAFVHGFTYTRYADDLTFSADFDDKLKVGSLLREAAQIVAHEGFEIHPDKVRLMRRGRRQEVTGIVVNDRLGVDRKTLRRLRAVIYQIEKDGAEGKTWNGAGGDVLASIMGYVNFVRMVDPEKGAAFSERVKALGYRPPPRKVYPKKTPSWKMPKEEASASPEASGKTDGKPWWKFW